MILGICQSASRLLHDAPVLYVLPFDVYCCRRKCWAIGYRADLLRLELCRRLDTLRSGATELRLSKSWAHQDTANPTTSDLRQAYQVLF